MSTAIPAPLTSFIGREREVGQIRALLRREEVRLVTLTGPGGVGKTRLAIRVAEEIAADACDGVWFVSLASVRDPAVAASAIAQALGLREAVDRPALAAVAAFLGEREGLLVLDNFEHILDAAPLVADLLARCPRLDALVTSREVLRVSGEHAVHVPPLSLGRETGVGSRHDALPPDSRLPSPVSEAARLFVERATAATVDFVLTSESAPAVAAICQRLDGLPLAIELAAARVVAFPPTVLLERLERRLPLLTGGPRDVPERLRTMRDAIAWSYDLLTPEEQALFRRLAVFVGGFTLEAAEYVSGEAGRREGGNGDPVLALAPSRLLASSALDGITSLVAKSLLRPTTAGGDERFAMLETVREFALEQLAAGGEEETVRDAHAAALLALAERAKPYLFGPGQIAWLDRVEVELPNIRAALGWLRERGRADEGLRLAEAPGRFWWRRGYVTEGRTWLASFLAMPTTGGASPVRIRALLVAGELAAWQKENEQAYAWYSEAAMLARDLGDEMGLAMALQALGSSAIDKGEPERAEPLLEESSARFLGQGDAFQAARAKAVHGAAALAQGGYDRAATYFDEALEVFRDRQDGRLVGSALEGLGLVALARGDAQGGRRFFAEALALASDQGDKTGIAWCLMGLAGVAGLVGQAEQAARLLGASAAMRLELGVRFQPYEQAFADRFDAAARTALSGTAFAAASESGAALPLADVIAAAATVGLTRRELDVLRLLGERLTDREIADRLFISRRTASHHVAALLAKLGVNSRHAAAAEARHLGPASDVGADRGHVEASRPMK